MPLLDGQKDLGRKRHFSGSVDCHAIAQIRLADQSQVGLPLTLVEPLSDHDRESFDVEVGLEFERLHDRFEVLVERIGPRGLTGNQLQRPSEKARLLVNRLPKLPQARRNVVADDRFRLLPRHHRQLRQDDFVVSVEIFVPIGLHHQDVEGGGAEVVNHRTRVVALAFWIRYRRFGGQRQQRSDGAFDVRLDLLGSTLEHRQRGGNPLRCGQMARRKLAFRLEDSDIARVDCRELNAHVADHLDRIRVSGVAQVGRKRVQKLVSSRAVVIGTPTNHGVGVINNLQQVVDVASGQRRLLQMRFQLRPVQRPHELLDAFDVHCHPSPSISISCWHCSSPASRRAS